MSEDAEKIHENGVKRHGAAWPNANQRAVNALGASQIRPWDPGVQYAVALVVLRVLDGVRMDQGETWSKEDGRWTPRTERKNDDTGTS